MKVGSNYLCRTFIKLTVFILKLMVKKSFIFWKLKTVVRLITINYFLQQKLQMQPWEQWNSKNLFKIVQLKRAFYIKTYIRCWAHKRLGGESRSYLRYHCYLRISQSHRQCWRHCSHLQMSQMKSWPTSQDCYSSMWILPNLLFSHLVSKS